LLLYHDPSPGSDRDYDVKDIRVTSLQAVEKLLLSMIPGELKTVEGLN
jgi:hypothetical protein